MGSTTSALGVAAPVTDARERVTGRSPFVVNEWSPSMLHGRILRSAQPHASVVGIDTSAALAIPGVMAIVTGADVPGDESGPRRFGTAIRDTPVLATDRVRYVGEPIAVVAAVDLDVAAEAIAAIEVELEPLAPALTIDEALAHGEPGIHPGGNLVGTREERIGDVTAALENADAVVTEMFEVPPLQGVPLETHTVLADWDSDGLTVHTATQTPFHVRRELAQIFDLPAETVRVITRTLGGGFGSKAYTRIEPLAALVARRAGRPVKFVLSRSEEFVTVHRQAARVTFTTGVSRDGHLVAIRAHCDFASGAYTDNTPRVLRHGLYSLVGPYRVDAVEISTRGVFTNTPPCGPLRAPGTAQVQWAREAHLDAVALAVGVDPVELRRRNLVAKSDRFILGGPMGPVHLHELLDAVGSGEKGEPRSSRRRRGRGVALAMKTTATPTTAQSTVTVDRRGRIGVLTSTVDMGQGARTALAQIAAMAMDVPLAHVDVSLPDTATTPPDDGTVSSRSTFSMGTAIERAAKNLRDRLLVTAEEQMEIARTDIIIERGRLRPVDRSSDGLSFGELVARSGRAMIEADGAFTNEAMYDPSTGETGVSTHHHQAAASALVEVDLDTGAVDVLEVRVATHAGVVVNPVLAELQSEGNVAFGVGQALMEELVMDGGQVQNANLGDYVIPSFVDMPRRVGVELTEDDLREVHGIGETALPAVVPAVTNAVANAAGGRIHTIPATPERVLRAMRALQT